MLKSFLTCFLTSFLLCFCGRGNPEERKVLVQDTVARLLDEDQLEGEKPASPTANSTLFEDSLNIDDSESELLSKFKEIRIALDNTSGVPFFEDDLGIYIEGFDIDSFGHMYFYGGQGAGQLVKHSGNKRIWSKEFENIDQSRIHHVSDSVILILNDKYGKNELHRLNSRNGEYIEFVSKILTNVINDCFFTESAIIAEVYNLEDSIQLNTSSGYARFDFNGQLQGEAENIFDIPNSLRGTLKTNRILRHCSSWRGKYLLFESSFDYYSFRLVDVDGSEENEVNIPFDSIPYELWGDFKEHTKIAGDKLYVLGREGYVAVVTIIDLVEVFK